jgi:hypothetical protein
MARLWWWWSPEMKAQDIGMSAMMIKKAVRIAGPIGMAAMLLALPACDTIGSPLELMGAKIPPPDEFQVIVRAPLIVPATTSRPEPRPGAASPLDPDPHRDALGALLGTSGSPVVNTIAPSAGEQVLLSSANAAATSSDIRVQLEEEKIAKEASKPYELPSVSDLLGGGEDDKLDESTLLDPVAESQRLQRLGNVAPVDPNASAEVDEKLPETEETPYPTEPPQNTFNN